MSNNAEASRNDMTFDEFTKLEKCPASVSLALQALWYDNKGDWDNAHKIVQDASDSDSDWVHAYLHRKEGDNDNARYWYRRSGKPEFKGDLNQEWEQMVSELLVELSAENKV